MNEKDRFLRELGQRLAAARKAEGLSQTELGRMVQVSQQVIADYEKGHRHIPTWRVCRVAEALGVDVAELLGGRRRIPRKRGPTPKIQEQLEAIAALPKTKRRFVADVLANILKETEDVPYQKVLQG
ncbi:MAG: helix-turn-helix transcriptional regulator [Kiritimatiellia bacterium]|jgi:transcriptional regulator with XRE-family HTH domain|nr:helix-turn-helix transcriptional regulator [Candidatus Brocadiia bacterium]MDP6631794.1 helix-turn-helix transcriptional regulator [Kiritimatiellia bacterium]MDP6810449.1 helix-turn-helix transcriptional regulator [Kiritimatiellia bacterium]MDP7024530.1 helix-turn-helix transcriptional regulator [Kiritimatiellia bacterium]